MSNVVVDYNGNTCVCNHDQCLPEDELARVGCGHYKCAAPETMKKPTHFIYENTLYYNKVNCFAVGVMARELATGRHAFANMEEDSNLVVADMNILYYNRKRNILSKLWVDFAESVSMNHIVEIIGA
jgi:hypothetical protein